MNTSAAPLVSIVTPVYNGSKYLEELIQSVIEQDYPHIEHIIIDDGSNDNGATVNILRRYPHLRWWSRENRGAYHTINEGLAATIGELVTVICADDKYATRTAISEAVKPFTVHSACDVVYGETIIIDKDSRVMDIEGPRGGPLWMFPYLTVITHCSMLVMRERVVDSSFYFDESFPYAADFDWIMRMIQAGYHFQRLKTPIAMFRYHYDQRSGDRSPARAAEVERLKLRYGEGNRLLRFLIHIWASLTRLKNLFVRRGILACVHEIRRRTSWPLKSKLYLMLFL